MAKGNISAPNNDNRADKTVVTGTDFSSETKRGLDIFSYTGMAIPNYDTITVTYPTTTTETYTYSLSAATVAVVTVTYTSTSKKDISTVVRSS